MSLMNVHIYTNPDILPQTIIHIHIIPIHIRYADALLFDMFINTVS